MFVVAIIFIILAVIALALAFTVGTTTKTVLRKASRYDEPQEQRVPGNRKWFFLVSGASAVIAILFTLFAMTFSLDTGSSAALKNWSGSLSEDPVVNSGFHSKAPWEDIIPWDVRNQNIMFTGDGTTTHNGQPVNGAQLSFTDKDGVSGDMDIQVVYSINPEKVVDLTSDYSNQETFAVTVVENDVKSLPRDIIAKYSTINVFNQRDQLRSDIEDALKDAWADKGIILDNVNIQGIRYPEDVNQRFKDAQNAQTDLVKADTQAKIDKTTADGKAQAAIAEANGEAEANRLIAQSLTPEVLQQRYIDALSKAGTIIVPNNFTSLGQIPAAPQ